MRFVEMSNNLLDSYNPLYDANLRHYFTSPHMQRHLRSIGLLDSNGVPVANNGNVDSEVYTRHYVMMDMLLRNRETQLMQLADLQRKLDAAEKVQSYRRVRSGNGSPDAGRRIHASRSLSRPRGVLNRRIRRHSNHYEDGDVIKRVEQEYNNEIPPIRNIYDRLSQRATRYRYLHKLDDKTLTSYKDSLQSQLNKLERFRDVSFGPYSVARQQGPQQNSWFFRRRSLPSLASSAPANSLHQPLRSINSLRGRARNGASESPRKLNGSHNSRGLYPTRADKARLPPLPKRPGGVQQKSKSKPPSLTKADSKDKLPTLAVVGVPVAAAAGAAVLGATALLNGKREEREDEAGSMVDYGPGAAEEQAHENGFGEEEHVRERREAVQEEEPVEPNAEYEPGLDVHENGADDHKEDHVDVEAEENGAAEAEDGPAHEPAPDHDVEEPVAFEVSADELKAEPEHHHVAEPAEQPGQVPDSVAFEVSAEELKDEPSHQPHEVVQEEHEEVPEPVAFEVDAEELKGESESHSETVDESVPEPDASEVNDNDHDTRDDHSAGYEEDQKESAPEADGEEPEAHPEDSEEPEMGSEPTEAASHVSEPEESPSPVPEASDESADQPTEQAEAEEQLEGSVPQPEAFEVSADELKEHSEPHEDTEEEPVAETIAEPVAFEVNADELKEDHQEKDGPSEQSVVEPVAFEIAADELKHEPEVGEEHESVHFDLSSTPQNPSERSFSVDPVQEERVAKMVEDSLQAASEPTPEPEEPEADEDTKPEEAAHTPESPEDEPEQSDVSQETVIHESSQEAPVQSPVAFEVAAEELKDHHEDEEDVKDVEPEPVAFEISAEDLKSEPADSPEDDAPEEVEPTEEAEASELAAESPEPEAPESEAPEAAEDEAEPEAETPEPVSPEPKAPNTVTSEAEEDQAPEPAAASRESAPKSPEAKSPEPTSSEEESPVPESPAADAPEAEDTEAPVAAASPEPIAESLEPEAPEAEEPEISGDASNVISPEPTTQVEREVHSENDFIKDDDEHEVNSFEVHHTESNHVLRDEPLLDAHRDQRLLSAGPEHPTINLIEPSDCGDSNYQEDVSMKSIPTTPMPPREAPLADEGDHEQEQDIPHYDNNSEYSEQSGLDRNISETPLKQPKNTPDSLSDDEAERMSTTLTDEEDDTSVTVSSRQDSIAA